MTGAEPSGFAARLEVRLASSNKRVKVVTYLISLLRTYQFDTRLAIQSGFNPVQNFRDNRELAERSIAAIAAGPLVSAHAGRSLSRGETKEIKALRCKVFSLDWQLTQARAGVVVDAETESATRSTLSSAGVDHAQFPTRQGIANRRP